MSAIKTSTLIVVYDLATQIKCKRRTICWAWVFIINKFHLDQISFINSLLYVSVSFFISFYFFVCFRLVYDFETFERNAVFQSSYNNLKINSTRFQFILCMSAKFDTSNKDGGTRSTWSQCDAYAQFREVHCHETTIIIIISVIIIITLKYWLWKQWSLILSLSRFHTIAFYLWNSLYRCI